LPIVLRKRVGEPGVTGTPRLASADNDRHVHP
jgi:hypothetical protein